MYPIVITLMSDASISATPCSRTIQRCIQRELTQKLSNAPQIKFARRVGSAMRKYVSAAAGCLVRTCSLRCSQEHKRMASCNGKRAREAFVELSAYDEDTLRSDFKLLEQATEAGEVAARACAVAPGPKPTHLLPAHLRDLLHHSSRAGVRLSLMNPGVALIQPAPLQHGGHVSHEMCSQRELCL